MNKFFDCFIFFLVFVFFTGAQAAENAYKTRQYFEQDRDAYVRGATAYLKSLSTTCRYKDLSLQENAHILPDSFVELLVRISPNIIGGKLFFKIGTINFAAALDSLLQKPDSTNKWIIDCTVAIALAELQGIRCMTGNDELFNRWCLGNLGKDSNGFAASVAVKSWMMQPNRVALEILLSNSQFLPGATVYFQQLSGIENFNITGNNQAINMLIACLQQQYGGVYHIKHPEGNMRGINTICDDQKQMVFFANSANHNTLSAQAIANMLVGEFDVDAKQLQNGTMNVVSEWRKTCIDILANITPDFDFAKETENFASILGSICYSDKASAAREILRCVQFYCFDFSVIRKSISVTAIVAFVNKFKSDEKFKAEFLAGFEKQEK
jgi:hypothetical protein